MLDTPVLFLIFNRPEQTGRVFEAIRRAKPRRLYVAADGPRPHVASDAENCALARQVVGQVDWDCQVQTLFRAQNLGCKDAVSTGITWFFSQEAEGIILEDDTLPDASFFTFCAQLLAHYRHDERVMHIGGSNYQFGRKRGKASYYFSNYNHIWGWATWRRTWQHYDGELKNLGPFQENGCIRQIVKDKREQAYWLRMFEAVKAGKINTWDFQWTFTVWSRGGISILPNHNLVINIGFGENATHTIITHRKLTTLKLGCVRQIVHPPAFDVQREADTYTFNTIISPPPPVSRRLKQQFSQYTPAVIKRIIRSL